MVAGRRSAAADVEKELASVKRQCHESFRQLRVAAASEAANLGAKLDAVDREVVGLLSINIALRRTMADAVESRREFESQIKQCMVGRDEWQSAVQEVARLRRETEQLGHLLSAKEEETTALQAALQVICWSPVGAISIRFCTLPSDNRRRLASICMMWLLVTDRVLNTRSLHAGHGASRRAAVCRL